MASVTYTIALSTMKSTQKIQSGELRHFQLIYIAEQVQTCHKWLPHIFGLCGTIINEQDLANQEIYQL